MGLIKTSGAIGGGFSLTGRGVGRGKGQTGKVGGTGNGSGGRPVDLGYITPFWPTVFYGMRKRNQSYAGSCCRVINKTSLTEFDIGFKADGWIDEVALAAARVPGEQLDMKTWYDQSGNGINLVTAAGALSTRPMMISSGGVVQGFSGHPAPTRPASDTWKMTVAANAAFGFGTGAFTVDAYGYQASSGVFYQQIVDFRTGAVAEFGIASLKADNTIQFYGGAAQVGGGTAASVLTANHLAWSYAGGAGGTFNQYINGVLKSSTAQSYSAGATRPLLAFNTQTFDTNGWVGSVGEIAIAKAVNQYPAAFTPRSYT